MGIRINFSDTQGSQLGLDPLPTGKYHVKITDGEIKESGPNAKNPGSQYINFEFTVQDGQYEGRKVWSNASLLPHALFTIKGILEATGHDVSGELDFDLNDLIGSDLVVKVNFLPAGEVNGRSLDDRNEVKRFYKYDEAKTGSVSGGSLLP